MSNFELMVCNHVTGEVVATYETKGLKQVRGIIRDWMNSGISIHDFNVMKSVGHEKLWQYVREYALELSLHKCDCCGITRPLKEMDFIEDSYEVCMAIVCKGECN